MTVILVMIIALLILFSIWLRMQRFRQGIADINTKPSLLSLALQELISVAGGIYLSLIMIVSFLKLDIPDSLQLRGVQLDPLAAISIGLSVLQPIILKIFNQY